MLKLETKKGTKNQATRTMKTSNASQRYISIDKDNNYVDHEIFQVLYTPKTLRHIIIITTSNEKTSDSTLQVPGPPCTVELESNWPFGWILEMFTTFYNLTM